LWGTNVFSAPTHRQWEVISTKDNYVRSRGIDSQKSLQTSTGTANNTTVNQFAWVDKD